MDNNSKKWLVDVLKSIERIENYFETNERNFNTFCANDMLKRAIERNLEIIGEAVKRILNQNPNTLISHTRDIVGLRNQIIHSYDTIVDEMIWGIVINHLPKLKIEVQHLLDASN